MRKLRVLFYLPALSSGGIEKVTLHLVQVLAQRFEIGVLGQATIGKTFLNKTYLPDNVLLFPSPIDIRAQRHSRLLAQVARLRRVLKDFAPDVILSHYPRTHLTVGLTLGLSFIKPRPKWIACEHGDPQLYLGSIPIRKSLKKILIRYLVNPDTFVVVSNSVKDKAKLLYRKNSFQLIYNPIVSHEIVGLSKIIPEHPFFYEEIPVILSMGRLVKSKGFRDLINAFALVRKCVDSRLIILGEGGERDTLLNLARKLGIERHLWMPGFVENPFQYLARATLFVFPSYSEGLPTSVVEAMALKVPVIAFDIAALREVCANAAHFVELGSVEGLAVAISKLLCDPIKREILGREGLYRAREMFSVEKAVEAYAKVIEAMVM